MTTHLPHLQYHWDPGRNQYIAESAVLPGFRYAADSVDALQSDIREALSEYLDAARERGAVIPAAFAADLDIQLIAAEGPLRFGDALPGEDIEPEPGATAEAAY